MAIGMAQENAVRWDEGRTVHPAVKLWLSFVILLVIAMVVVGGATRLTDSGLSITEWKPILGAIPPLSAADWQDAFEKYKQIPEYSEVNAGMTLAQFKFIFWWEWGHRFLGRFIGLAFGLPLVFFWLRGMIPGRMAPWLGGLFLLGGLQGFVGWYMVRSGLVDRVDVSQYRLALHLSIAFLILALLVRARLWLDEPERHVLLPTISRGQLWIAGGLVLLIFLQGAIGGFVAGTKAGLVYNTWPLMDGELIPPKMYTQVPWWLNLFENLTTIQFNHRVTAYVIVAVVLFHAVVLARRSDDPAPSGSAWVLTVAVFAQAGLGIWTLLAAEGRNTIPIWLGLVHQGGAAIVLAIAVWHYHRLAGSGALRA